MSAAAFLAEAGAAVELFERSEVAAGASGRNSGVLQHPFDPELVPLHRESLEIYRTVLPLPDDPAGILMLGWEQGPVFKKVLDAVREAQLEGTIRTKQDAIRLAEELKK